MTWQDYVGMILGIVCIAIGLAYAFSPRFAAIAFGYTSQGLLWKKLVGERFAPLVAKYVFSLAGIAFGLWLIYVSVWKV
jgi:hypothetical protein